MERRYLDQLAIDLTKAASRRRVFMALAGATTSGVLGLFGIRQLTQATPAPLTAIQPEAVPPPGPGDYCWNSEGAVPQPASPPTPFLYQPFAFPPDARTDFGRVWSAQMDHGTPTYRQDGGLFTLGENLAFNIHRDEQDPDGPLLGGTKVYLEGGGYSTFDYTVSPDEITRQTGSTIFAYESPANEQYLFYDGHDGHDFAITGDALAAAAGTVAFAGDSGTALGRVVEISHPEGYLTRYAHLATIAVEVGQGIDTPGVPIGQIGGSRTVAGVIVDPPDSRAWGVHLHFSTFRWNDERQGWQITDPFGWDPWQSPGEQGEDPLVACNGEVSYNLWFGWWPRPYGAAADAAVLSARPTNGRYLGGSLAEEAVQQVATPSAATAVPAITIFELAGRAQAAIRQAGTYRYQVFDVRTGTPSPVTTGEVNILQQAGHELATDGSFEAYHIGAVDYLRWSAGGPWEMQERGAPWQDALLLIAQEFVNPSAGWVLDSTATIDGRPAFVLRQTGTARSGASSDNTVWVDVETFLPTKLLTTFTDASGAIGSQRETVFTDFGAPINVQVPPEALAPTPTPTPPEPANPLTSSDPVAIAEGLLDAIFANDFDRARHYFAPDNQPDSMRQVLGYWTRFKDADEAALLDLYLGCRGLEYTVVERQGQASGIQYSEVVFVFPSYCAQGIGVGLAQYHSDQIAISLENSTGRWYVENVRVEEP